MRSRIPVGLLMMLAAMVLSLVPAVTLTAQPAAALSTCDAAQFIADVTVPDGTNFAAGVAFTKTWRLKNIGTCTWTTSYALAFSSGSQMGAASSVNLPSSVAPGQSVDLSLNLTAPGSAGHYIGYWKLKNAAGTLFGIGSTASKAWWVEINVTGGSSSAGAVYDFAANYCSAAWASSQGSLPCPGADGDARGFILNVNQPKLENGATDPGVGLITAPQNTFNGDIHGTYPAFHVEAGDHFQSIINCAYGSTSCDVTFRLDYQIGSGAVNTLWSAREAYEGLFARADVDLSSLAGQDVKFILSVLASGSATGDRALWADPVITRAGATPPTANARKFDFGTATSPVAPGYVRVTETTAYVPGGYGWTAASNAESRDRPSQADPLKRDFVMSGTSAPTFMVDLPNGNYAVTVTMGDNDAAHDNMVVKANGKVMLPDVDTAAGAYAVNTFIVTVNLGSLTLQFLDAGGTDSIWVVNGVSIASTSQTPAGCDRAQFVADVTVPDGTVYTPGAAFTKTWRLKNVGTCTWTTFYTMIFDRGDKMGGPDLVNLPQNVAPGQTVDVSVNLTVPNTAGSYRGFWKFQNADGVPFGVGTGGTNSWWVDIRAFGTPITFTPTSTQGTVTATTTPTVTPTPSTATSTPTPATVTATPTAALPPSACDRAQFVTDVTVPDGSVYAPGAQFDKVWRLKNVGSCTWTTSYALVFDSGEKMGGPDSVPMPGTVTPGHTVDVLVHLSAPNTAGSYRGFWKFQNGNGARFGLGTLGTNAWWVDIRVFGTPISQTPTATQGTVTATVSPTATATAATPIATQPPSGCDRALFIADVTVPDGKVFSPGAAFVKTWRLRNVGTCTWTTSYALVFETGERMGGPNLVNMPKTVTPGSSVDVSVNLTAPTMAGAYRGYWRFQNASGIRFGLGSDGTRSWWVDIKVSGTDTSGWNTYVNGKYGFSFKYPPGSTLVSQTDTGGRVDLPFASGTNLLAKHLDVSIVEGASTCKSPQSQGPSPRIPTENVTFNGIPFLKETWNDAAMSHRGDFTAYSTLRGNACISLTFWLWSVVPEVMETPPPPFDPVAETAVFTTIMSTFGLSSAPPTATNTPLTSTSTPTPTPTGSDTTGWDTYANVKYAFSFKYPPGSSIVSQSDNSGRVNLPFTAGTTLKDKWIDVTVVEGANPCKSPNAGQVTSSELMTINGIQFLRELGLNGTAGHFYDITAYSTFQNNACISLTFQLRSVDPGVLTTPPPNYDKTAETAVFPVIMSTFGLSSPPPTATNTPPAPTSTPTPTLSPTPTGSDTTGWDTYVNSQYGFSFKYPPGSSIESQLDRVNLPFTAGTTLLSGKWIDVTVVEGANPCKSPNAGLVSSSENVTINGIQFLKELGGEGTAGHFYYITSYSTLKNTACISLTFVLKSVDPGVYLTPPPDYDKAAESAVFLVIMSTFGYQ